MKSRKLILTLVSVSALGAAAFSFNAMKEVNAAESAPVSAQQPGENPAANLPKQEFPTLREDDYVLGEATAPVTMFEYASLSCSHCAHFHNDILPKLKEKYIDTGKLRLVFRHFPLNEPALHAAQMTLCAPRDKFFTYLKVLFSQQDKWAFTESTYIDNIATIAQVGGMSREKFDACMADTGLQISLANERKYATDTLKIQSTPTFYIGEKAIEGARGIEDFEAVINPLLENK